MEKILKARWNSDNKGIKMQHIHFLRVDPENMQAAIQRLFDASTMLEDSAFRDFVAALCKLSLEMVSMQSGVDVGAGAGIGEGALDGEEDNIPSASTSATSLVTPRTKQFSRRRVHIPRTSVRYVRLPLSTPIFNAQYRVSAI
jgi:hypothetical protein